jgi:hypothetical protein
MLYVVCWGVCIHCLVQIRAFSHSYMSRTIKGPLYAQIGSKACQ